MVTASDHGTEDVGVAEAGCPDGFGTSLSLVGCELVSLGSTSCCTPSCPLPSIAPWVASPKAGYISPLRMLAAPPIEPLRGPGEHPEPSSGQLLRELHSICQATLGQVPKK